MCDNYQCGLHCFRENTSSCFQNGRNIYLVNFRCQNEELVWYWYMVPPDEKLNYSLIPQVMFTGEHSSGKQT